VDYVRRIRDGDGMADVIARVVKAADIQHNASSERSIPNFPRERLLERYSKALAILNGEIA
jgi:hypothetical protein